MSNTRNRDFREGDVLEATKYTVIYGHQLAGPIKTVGPLDLTPFFVEWLENTAALTCCRTSKMQEDLTPIQFICTHIFRGLNSYSNRKNTYRCCIHGKTYLPDLLPFRKGPDVVERYLLDMLDILKSTKLGRMLQKPVSIYDPILLEPAGKRKQIW